MLECQLTSTVVKEDEKARLMLSLVVPKYITPEDNVSDICAMLEKAKAIEEEHPNYAAEVTLEQIVGLVYRQTVLYCTQGRF